MADILPRSEFEVPAVPIVNVPRGAIVTDPDVGKLIFPVPSNATLLSVCNVVNLPVRGVVAPIFTLSILPVTVGLIVTVPVGVKLMVPVPARLTVPATFNPVNVPSILTTLDPSEVGDNKSVPL